jgi:hypothetical protein
MPASLARPSATPPERLAAGPLVLRRVQADDAGVIAAAVGASLEHLARDPRIGLQPGRSRRADAEELLPRSGLHARWSAWARQKGRKERLDG